MMGFRFLFFVSLMQCGLWSALDAAVYALKSELQISKAQICLRDILEPTSASLLSAEHAEIPVQRIEGAGPYTISAKRIFQILNQNGIYQVGDRVSGSSRITWEQIILSSEELVEKVQLDVQQRLAHFASLDAIHIDVTRQPAAMMINKDESEPYELLLEPLQEVLFGDVPYRVRIVRGQRELARTMLILQVKVQKDVAVARSTLTKGHVIGVGDLRLQSFLFTERRQAEGLLSFDGLVGTVVAHEVKADLPINDFMVRKPYAVFGGQLIDMVYQHEEFQISLRGRANGNASIGEEVSVRGVDGGQLVTGRVIANGQVQIQ